MKQQKAVLALLLCLLLTACSGEKAEDSRGQASFLGEAAQLEEGAILLTVDGREVPAWRYLFWLGSACGQISRQYEKAGVALDWEAELDSGTLAKYAREQALKDTVLYATVENWAEEHGCIVTDSEAQAADTFWVERENLGLTAAQCTELARVGLLYAALCVRCSSGDTELTPDAAQIAAFAEEEGYLTVDRILIAAGEDMDAARQRAEEVFSALNGAEDQEKVFAELAAAGDDPTGLRTLLRGDGTLDAALEDAAKALSVGQISGILESSEGFSILRRAAPAVEELTEAYFDTLLRRRVDAAEVITAPEYDALEAAVFWDRVQQCRKAVK